jgi:hypothetical protein
MMHKQFYCNNYFAFSQKIEFDKKTKEIKVDKIVIGKIEVLTENSIDQLGILGDNTVYSIKDLTGKEIILAKTISKLIGLGDYGGNTEYLFRDSGKIAYTNAYSQKTIAKELVNFGILTKEGYNVEGEKKLLLLFSKKPKEISSNNTKETTTTIITQNTHQNQMLERDRNADIYVMGDEISQDLVEIGKITDSEDVSGEVYKVFNHQNTQIAEATCEFMGKVVKIVTFKDNKTYSFTKKGISDDETKEQIARYLNTRYYW